ncbi:Pyridinium-3,5-biscarboxylic acid mononucleotide synthase [Desulfovibrionales bacterium]
MDQIKIIELLQQVAAAVITPEAAYEALQNGPFASVIDSVRPDICLDIHRELRTGVPEAVFGPGKSSEQLVAAVTGLAAGGRPVMATRLTLEQGDLLREQLPEGTFWPEARVFVLGRELALAPPWPSSGEILGLTAGASDLTIGLEFLATARFLGLNAGLVTDSGVAGLHRLKPHLSALRRARLLVVIAGMDGALPSVVAGLVGRPIIAVPTSVGYGASFGGLAALLTMLNSCAPGMAVVNIDNGFGAAVLASQLLALPALKPATPGRTKK